MKIRNENSKTYFVGKIHVYVNTRFAYNKELPNVMLKSPLKASTHSANQKFSFRG